MFFGSPSLFALTVQTELSFLSLFLVSSPELWEIEGDCSADLVETRVREACPPHTLALQGSCCKLTVEERQDSSAAYAGESLGPDL